jgi:phosphoribosyl 1,2-cyclic phosphate phosphodiesterase
MKALFLGTGTSTGIPQIGCKCETCISTNVKDKRLRASVMITDGEDNILIDCGPDFRQQMLDYNINKLTAIVLTHEHYDHMSGLDDIRPLGDMKVYAQERVLNTIRQNMYYCFAENKYPGVPQMRLVAIDNEKFRINNTVIEPIQLMHYKLPILGFRIGNFAYLTDVKTIEDSCMSQLANLDVLVINALRHHNHIAHLTLDEALILSKQIGAKQTYFTHMSHELGPHDEISRLLPDNVSFAYDGLVLELENLNHDES